VQVLTLSNYLSMFIAQGYRTRGRGYSIQREDTAPLKLSMTAMSCSSIPLTIPLIRLPIDIISYGAHHLSFRRKPRGDHYGLVVAPNSTPSTDHHSLIYLGTLLAYETSWASTNNNNITDSVFLLSSFITNFPAKLLLSSFFHSISLFSGSCSVPSLHLSSGRLALFPLILCNVRFVQPSYRQTLRKRTRLLYSTIFIHYSLFVRPACVTSNIVTSCPNRYGQLLFRHSQSNAAEPTGSARNWIIFEQAFIVSFHHSHPNLRLWSLLSS
jgi:hypothetical protein